MENALENEDAEIRALLVGKQRCENQYPHQTRYISPKEPTAISKVRVCDHLALLQSELACAERPYSSDPLVTKVGSARGEN